MYKQPTGPAFNNRHNSKKYFSSTNAHLVLGLPNGILCRFQFPYLIPNIFKYSFWVTVQSRNGILHIFQFPIPDSIAIIDPVIDTKALPLGDSEINASIDMNNVEEVRDEFGHSEEVRESDPTLNSVLEHSHTGKLHVHVECICIQQSVNTL